MTKRQVLWATTHDWFMGALQRGPNEWEVLVWDRYVDIHGVLHEDEAAFTCIHELRAFAGY